MARNNQVKKGAGKEKFSLIVDGETEIWYFQLMKQHESLSIDIKPEIPKRKSLQAQFEMVAENAKHYDKVFWLVDYDAILKENKETKKGQKSIIQVFIEYKEKLSKVANTVVLVINPCWEFWLLAHFEETSKFYSTCEEAEKALKKHLPAYQKTEEYYKKANHDLYQQLKTAQAYALKNAKKQGNFDIEKPYSAISEVFILFEMLKIGS